MAKNSAAKITRRSFAGICMGTAAAGSAGLKSLNQVGKSQVVSRSTPTTTIDQNPIRRRGTGLRALDIDRASAGLTMLRQRASERFT